ncbi:endothelin-converting enzyme homolog [Nephila pilipes]|uniref:Endothelin-converting enzyme homolog n=1 Tax=Nephila pilipes TaxID=299642 RepID=A0A8X6PCM0_NEPPI|nr:endothelin-converting enzyme homolog [Nephila pilipes]
MDTNERIRLHQRDSERAETCAITTPLEKRLLIILIIVVAIGIGLCLALAANTKGISKKYLTTTICLNKECISTASNLLHSMDEKQEPCDDFYSFVCGNWIKNTFLIGEISTQFTQLNSVIYLRIKELLETRHEGIAEHENKTQKFYKACMDGGTRDEEGSKVLSEDLKKFGGWPLLEETWNDSNFNWTDLLIQFFENGYPIDMLLSITIEVDIKNTSAALISVNQPTLGLRERGYFILTTEKPLKRYKELILEIAKYLKPELNETNARKDIEEAIKIETSLAKATVGKLNRNPDKFYNIFSLNEVEAFAPKIPWRYLLSKLLPHKTELHEDQRFMVIVPHALKALNNVLENTTGNAGKRNLANYMFYRAVLFAAEHLQTDLFYLYEDKLRRSAHRDMWQMCVGTVIHFFHMSLTATYAERYMDAASKYNLEMMFQDIQASLLDEIKTAKWLDQETREKALLKVKKTRSTIAYRDEIKNEEKLNDYYSPVEVGEAHFSNMKSIFAFKMKERMKGLEALKNEVKWSNMNSVLTANAFYTPSQNAIILPIGLLQETFFSSGRPNYINYGSLGSILGHEFTHAFDNSGSLYDEDGNYRMWWTKQSWLKYTEKTQCFVDQYNEYYEPKVDSLAYQKLLKRIGTEPKLPGLPYSERQMFWIAFASVWCRKQTNHHLEYTIENSVHAPAKFRVNGALSNIKEFSEDFKCEKGSKLNPDSKCSLWQ